jgi:hypothetical protein
MEVPPRTQKVNWDVAIDSPNRRIGIDIIVRDHEGCVIVARSTTGYSGGLVALQSVGFNQDLGLQQTVLEGNAIQIVNGVKANKRN